ncbi:MAG TPA: hypothetical protein VFD73_01585 [Gemmatimonadales bacterium]|nr:hypothetical protein [Gemmatimonadales bacterium]
MRTHFPDLEAKAPARHVMTNWEPTLDELLGEPIVRQLMARDGVTEPAMRSLASRIGERRGSASERGRTAPRASEQRERVKAHLRAVLKRLNERLRQRT